MQTVLLNIYQAFRLVAAKYVAYVVEWGADTVRGWKFFHGQSLLGLACVDDYPVLIFCILIFFRTVAVIEKLLIFFFACTKRQVEQEYVKNAGGCCEIRLRNVTW
jgi:hypothetical protein